MCKDKFQDLKEIRGKPDLTLEKHGPYPKVPHMLGYALATASVPKVSPSEDSLGFVGGFQKLQYLLRPFFHNCSSVYRDFYQVRLAFGIECNI
jgi:hypothetical protein